MHDELSRGVGIDLQQHPPRRRRPYGNPTPHPRHPPRDRFATDLFRTELDPHTRWPAAAVMLFGLGVVIATAILQHRSDTPTDDVRATAVPQQPRPATPPDWQIVATRAQIDALPADTRFVEGRNLADNDVAALTRLPRLEGLKLTARSYVDQYPPLCLLSDAVLPTLGKLHTLRILHLDWQLELSGKPLDCLRTLPLLEELGLQRFDTDDATLAVVERLPSLRRLDLTLNLGFRGDGIAAIARCPGIRSLRLASCHQLSPAMLQPIAGMRQLEELDVSHIGDGTRGFMIGGNNPAAVAAAQDMQRQWREDGAGLSNEALAILADKPKLRRLVVGSNRIDDAGLERLAAMPMLQELDLNGCSHLTAATLARIPVTVRKLDLTATPFVDQDLAAVCRRLRGLEEVRFCGHAMITDAGVAELCALPALQKLELTGCSQLTRACVAAMQSSSQLREVRLDGLPWLAAEHLEPLLSRGIRVVLTNPRDELRRAKVRMEAAHATTLAMRADQTARVVAGIADIEALPTTVTAIDGIDLDDNGLAALGRLHQLERVRLRAGVQTRVGIGELPPRTEGSNHAGCSDAGLRQLASLTNLRELELLGLVDVHGAAFAALATLPKLESLRITCFDPDDAALAALPRFPTLRRLRIEWSHGFGGDGLRAIAACPQLQELHLLGCGQLQGEDLAELGSLASLRVLSLRRLNGRMLRDDSLRKLTADEARVRATAAAAADSPDAGVTDALLPAFSGLQHLEALDLGWGRITGDKLQGLGELHRLRKLDLTGNPLSPRIVKQLPPWLEALTLGHCPSLGRGFVAPLLQRMPNLSSLDLARQSGLDDNDIQLLLARTSLRHLGLSSCTGLTPAAVDQLFAAGHLAELDLRDTPGWLPWRIEAMRRRGVQVQWNAP